MDPSSHAAALNFALSWLRDTAIWNFGRFNAAINPKFYPLINLPFPLPSDWDEVHKHKIKRQAKERKWEIFQEALQVLADGNNPEFARKAVLALSKEFRSNSRNTSTSVDDNVYGVLNGNRASSNDRITRTNANPGVLALSNTSVPPPPYPSPDSDPNNHDQDISDNGNRKRVKLEERRPSNREDSEDAEEQQQQLDTPPRIVPASSRSRVNQIKASPEVVVTANEPANQSDSSSSSVGFSSISSDSGSQSGLTDSGNFGTDMSAESSDDSGWDVGIERHDSSTNNLGPPTSSGESCLKFEHPPVVTSIPSTIPGGEASSRHGYYNRDNCIGCCRHLFIQNPDCQNICCSHPPTRQLDRQPPQAQVQPQPYFNQLHPTPLPKMPTTIIPNSTSRNAQISPASPHPALSPKPTVPQPLQVNLQPDSNELAALKAQLRSLESRVQEQETFSKNMRKLLRLQRKMDGVYTTLIYGTHGGTRSSGLRSRSRTPQLQNPEYMPTNQNQNQNQNPGTVTSRKRWRDCN